MWELGIELRSSARAINALINLAIFPDPCVLLYDTTAWMHFFSLTEAVCILSEIHCIALLNLTELSFNQ